LSETERGAKDLPKNSMGMKRDAETGEVSFDMGEALKSVGGVSGLIESTIPGAVYVASFVFTRNVWLSVALAVACSLASLVAQIVRKRSLVQVLIGAIGIAISAYLPLSNPSQPASYFVPGFFTNLSYGAVILVSLLVRWPVIGLAISLFNGTAKSWRRNKSALRRYDFATALWVCLFGARLAVQLPLYYANNLVGLGIAKEVMGLPLYGLTLWFTWLIVRSEIRKPANGNFESDSREH